MEKTKTRLVWIDNVKVIAIILVALGHLVQSLYKSNLYDAGSITAFSINTLYLFHVPLFFICSGFLFQHFTKEQTIKSYSKNLLKKLLAFGVPYFVFSFATYILKFIFSSSVNTENNGSLLHTLFARPAAPYWFLYSLFLIFIICPVFKSKADAIIRLVVSVGLFIAADFIDFGIFPEVIKISIYYIFTDSIWFVLGMVIAYFDIPKYFKGKQWCIVFFFIFIAMSYLYYEKNILSSVDSLTLVLGMIACFGIIFFIGACYYNNKQTKVFGFLSKYTMPIFLMHTIFASATRSVLLKIGISNLPIHIVCGIAASIVFPVIAAMIMEKIKLDILYNPTKYIKIK